MSESSESEKVIILETNKGKTKIGYQGYMYVEKKVCKEHITWRCCKFGKPTLCPATLTTNLTMLKPTFNNIEHNHLPDSHSVNASEAYSKMKRKALSSTAKPSHIFSSISAELSSPVQQQLPRKESAKRTLRNIRNKNISTNNNDTKDIVITGPWTTTQEIDEDTNRHFLLQDDNDKNSRIMISATDQDLQHLGNSDEWSMDGNFKLVPPQFMQLVMGKRKNYENYEKSRKKLQMIQEHLEIQAAWQSSEDGGSPDHSDHGKDPTILENSEASAEKNTGNGPIKENEDGELPAVQGLRSTKLLKLDEESDLNNEILEFSGEDKPIKENEEFEFHSKLANQWRRIILKGLSRGDRMKTLDKYPRKGNCPLNTAVINREFEFSVNDSTKKRDEFLALNQDLCGAGLSALGSAIGMIFNEKKEINKDELLTVLWDSGKLFSELFHQLMKARKALIYPSLDGKTKAWSQKAVTDEFLFGSGLSQQLKTGKSVASVGSLGKPETVEEKAPPPSESFSN